MYAGRLHGSVAVAIKVLHPANLLLVAANQEAQEHFWAEARLLHSLRHPHLVTLLGVVAGGSGSSSANTSDGVEGGQALQRGAWMLVMELMEGGSLAQHLGDAEMAWRRQGAAVAADVARALVWLHSQKMVHRDIKSGVSIGMLACLGAARLCSTAAPACRMPGGR